MDMINIVTDVDKIYTIILLQQTHIWFPVAIGLPSTCAM